MRLRGHDKAVTHPDLVINRPSHIARCSYTFLILPEYLAVNAQTPWYAFGSRSSTVDIPFGR